jgi:hypothetical protein
MIIQHVHPNQVPQLLPVVRSYIERGLEFTDSCNVDHTCAYLVTGAWTLLVAVVADKIEGAYVLALSNTPTDRTALIVSAAGAGLASQEAFDQVKEIAKQMGATQIQVLARESAARLYKRVGLSEKATLMEIKL